MSGCDQTGKIDARPPETSSESSANAAPFSLLSPCRTPNEARRRRDLLRKLSNERQRLKAAERAPSSNTDRDSLLGNGDGRKYGKEGSSTRDMTSDQMMAMTQQDMTYQNEILDNMSKGLDGLKNMGIAIRDETDLHMRLIDDIEAEVDKGNDNLKRETARAEHITRDTKTCWLYITICILLAILVTLVMVRWA